jgi:tellurite resistance protein TehA-like permease
MTFPLSGPVVGARLWKEPMRRPVMTVVWIVLSVVAALAVVLLAMTMHVVDQYEKGVLFRLGRVIAVREPGLTSSSRSSTS